MSASEESFSEINRQDSVAAACQLRSMIESICSRQRKDTRRTRAIWTDRIHVHHLKAERVKQHCPCQNFVSWHWNQCACACMMVRTARGTAQAIPLQSMSQVICAVVTKGYHDPESSLSQSTSQPINRLINRSSPRVARDNLMTLYVPARSRGHHVWSRHADLLRCVQRPTHRC